MLAPEAQRLELHRLLKNNKKLFEKMEFAKAILVIAELQEAKYRSTKAKLTLKIEERRKEGVDYSEQYK